MTAHTHTRLMPGCHRCELNKDEMPTIGVPMPSVWTSTHLEVIEWWEDIQKRDKRYYREVRKVKQETGRDVVLRTGFGDDQPMGLSKENYQEEPPPGWKLGWGKRSSGFFEPRFSPRSTEEKKACEEAQALIKRLIELHADARKEAEDRFGVPSCQLFGWHAISPGYWFHDGVLWVTFDTHDFEPSSGKPGLPQMLDFFVPAKLSEFHAAREAAGVDKEDE